MHAFWLVLTYDLLEDKRIDDVIIKTFALCFFKMNEDFKMGLVSTIFKQQFNLYSHGVDCHNVACEQFSANNKKKRQID